MTCDEGIRSEFVQSHGLFGERTRIANWKTNTQKVRIDKPSLLFLEDSIEKFQNLPSKKLVISINNQKDILRPTKLFSSSSNIGHSSFLLLISNNDISRCIYSILIVFEETLNISSSCIITGIINENNMIICIVLHQNRSHIFVM